MTNLSSLLKSRDNRFADRGVGPYSQSYDFPVVTNGRVSWTIKKAECQRTDAFELWCWQRLSRVPWTGNQPWILIVRNDAEAEAPILWPPDVELTHWKRPWHWKDWRQEKGVTENEIVWWHHWFNRHDFEQTLGDSKGQEACMLQFIVSQRVGHNWATELRTVF